MNSRHRLGDQWASSTRTWRGSVTRPISSRSRVSTSLKRVGKRFVGLCPFHAEKTPSFNVNPEIGRYYCFGCQQNGTRSPSSARWSTSTSSTRSSGWRRVRGSRSATTTGGSRRTRDGRAGTRRSPPLSSSTSGCLPRARGRRGAASTSRPGLRRRRGTPVRARGGRPTGWDRLSVRARRRSSPRTTSSTPVSRSSTRPTSSRTSSAPAHVPDLRHQGRSRRLRRAHARRRRAEVQELARDDHLPEEPACSTASTGRRRKSARQVRSCVCEGYTDVHRRSRGGARPRGRHVWHRAGRRAFPDRQELRPPSGARLRRRRGRAGRGRAVLRVGASVRDRHRRGPAPCRRRPGRRRRANPDAPARCRRGAAVPCVPRGASPRLDRSALTRGASARHSPRWRSCRTSQRAPSATSTSCRSPTAAASSPIACVRFLGLAASRPATIARSASRQRERVGPETEVIRSRCTSPKPSPSGCTRCCSPTRCTGAFRAFGSDHAARGDRDGRPRGGRAAPAARRRGDRRRSRRRHRAPGRRAGAVALAELQAAVREGSDDWTEHSHSIEWLKLTREELT